MSASIQVEINLTPIFEKDQETQYYIGFFKEFPNACGTGKTEKEAEESLWRIFKVMLNDEGDDIKRQLVEKYMPNINFTGNNHFASA